MERKMCKRISVCTLVLLMGISLLPAFVIRGESGLQVHTAPENPPHPPPVVVPMTLQEVQEFIERNGYTYTAGETWLSQLSPAEFANLLRYVPPSMDLSHLSVSSDGELPSDLQLPPAYDYRALGMVTPPKNQRNCGSCWAFAAVGMMESRVLKENGPFYDLSEENVLSCNYTNNGCGGGNDIIVTNYLSKYGGSLESCAPYDAVDGTPCADCTILRRLLRWRIIGTNLDSENPTQISRVKQALMSSGPLFVTMNASAPGFSSYWSGVFEYWGSGTVNHAVLLVGWDDSLTHTHGSGAWICKNSWGTSWGQGGYFYIAYGSANICEYVSAFTSTRGYDYYEKLYYYDDAGWRGSFYTNPEDTWGAVRFVPTVSGVLERVEFWNPGTVLNFDIRIYDTKSGGNTCTFTGLLSSQTGTYSKSGYYSVGLTTKPVVTAGNDFIVVVRFNTPGYDYSVPLDNRTPISGQSYVSNDGSTWQSLSSLGHNWDIGIRALVQQPVSTFAGYPGYFDTNSFFVVGNNAYCTDVLGTGKVAYGLSVGGVTENPEGRTHTILTTGEHDTGNLIPVGGPGINPIAAEFDDIFGITYEYNAGVSFEIFAGGRSIYLDLTHYPAEDVCIVYLGDHNSRLVMLVWGYGWRGSYAGSVFMGDPANWQAYPNAHLLLLRWIDTNGDGLVQMAEISVEAAV